MNIPGLSPQKRTFSASFKRAYRHSELRKLQLWLKAKTLHWALYLVLACLILGSLLGLHHYLYSHLYVVRMDGAEVGLVRDPGEVEQFLYDLTCKCSSLYQMELFPEQEITLTREHRPGEADNIELVRESLRQRLRFLTDAVMITVDGFPVAPVTTADGVDRVIEQVCHAFVRENEQVEVVQVELAEEIAGQRCAVSPEQVYTADEIAFLLTGQEYDPELSLSSRPLIASRFGRNELDDESGVTAPAVHVRSVEVITLEERIPFSTTYVSSDSIYLGESRAASPGKDGLQEVTYRVTRENGLEQSREVVSKRVITKPIARVVERGTRRRFAWPVSGGGRVTQRFHGRHRGIDIAASTNTPILAAESGVVVKSAWGRTQGNYIVINHGSYYTLYLHNNTNLVSAGQRVSRGQIIARLGSTGNSTGPHLHFEIRRKAGSKWGGWNAHPAINPMQFFR